MIKIMDWGEKRRYEEPRPIYLNKDNIGGMNECHEEDGDFTAIWTKEERPVVFLVKETPEEILAMPDIETTEKVIDWEQRRYEIAKGIFGIIFKVSYDTDDFTERECIAETTVRYADALIKGLKKGQDNEN